MSRPGPVVRVSSRGARRAVMRAAEVPNPVGPADQPLRITSELVWNTHMLCPHPCRVDPPDE
ncbi:hypothetical protein Arub01_43330 [Actinomadura rubrobrunea]|uniref:Uncharacterized protein n=1 Tax=Actinomadura rubrobrunea TaxID=115335 RepID=A0A9W6PX79_9ACTN|nr:hypothetical protein Arub01_43330 [Actinomadura rubrobrunea]